MIRSLIYLLLALSFVTSRAQIRIDSSFAFQTNPAKKYSIYVPSTYNPAVANPLMVGFHPLNAGVWDAEYWCDTLSAFAEMNNLILVCPDGGANGDITDPIDYDFTTALLDSMALWYNIDAQRVYAMGFSMGGVATYEYGFNHAAVFGGFIPVGAAVAGSGAFPGIIANASGKPYYVIHGGNDLPAIRFSPMLNGLDTNCAIVDSLLMPGVGHTIDFPNRNQVLTNAYLWIDSINLAPDTITTAYSPIAPNTGSNITIQGFTDQSLTFSWSQPAFGNSCVQYELLMDLLSGDFSTPLYSILPPNGGTDTTVEISYHVLDSLLQDQGVVIGNILTVKWAVASTYYGRFTDTTKSFLLNLRHQKLGFSLITPSSGKTVELTNGLNLVFDWEDLLGSGITYELLFDSIGGDFSNPLYAYESANSGTSSLLTKSHQELYYDMLFEDNIAVGDTLHLLWTAKASDMSLSELAKPRALHLRRGPIGFELINPAEKVVINSRKGVVVTFMWDSVPLPNITYEVLIDTVNGDFTNPLTVFPSNASGSHRRLFAEFPILDSVLNVFEIQYGDTLDAKWTAKAISPTGEFFAFQPFGMKIFRDFPDGISTVETTGKVKVYPNPVSSNLRVYTGETGPQLLPVELYSTDGKLLRKERYATTGQSTLQIDISGIRPGMYILQIHFEEGMVSRRVTIQ